MSFQVRNSICILQIFLRFHDIERSSDDFFMDVSDIDTDKPKCHKHYSYHDGIDHDDDTDIGKSEIGDSYLIDELEEKCNPSEKYNEKSHIPYEFQWEK